MVWQTVERAMNLGRVKLFYLNLAWEDVRFMERESIRYYVLATGVVLFRGALCMYGYL